MTSRAAALNSCRVLALSSDATVFAVVSSASRHHVHSAARGPQHGLQKTQPAATVPDPASSDARLQTQQAGQSSISDAPWPQAALFRVLKADEEAEAEAPASSHVGPSSQLQSVAGIMGAAAAASSVGGGHGVAHNKRHNGLQSQLASLHAVSSLQLLLNTQVRVRPRSGEKACPPVTRSVGL